MKLIIPVSLVYTFVAEATVTNVYAHFYIRKVKGLEYSFTCTCCIYLAYN